MVLDFQTESPVALVMALRALVDWAIEGDFTNDGYPSDCAILNADDDGLTICEYDDSGVPIRNATWLVPWDEIRRITVL